MTRPWTPGVAVLGRQPHLRAERPGGAAEEVEAAGVGAVAEAEQDAVRDAALGEAPAQQGERRNPDPAADQDRAGGARRRPRAATAKELPSGPVTQTPSPAAERAEPLASPGRPRRAGSRAARRRRARGRGLGDRDRPRQEGPAVLGAPALRRRRACRTGPPPARGPRGRAARRPGSRPSRDSRTTSQSLRPKGAVTSGSPPPAPPGGSPAGCGLRRRSRRPRRSPGPPPSPRSSS